MGQQAFENNLANLQATLIKKLAPYRWDPLGFVERVFPWGTGKLVNSAGPLPWQRQLLAQIGAHFANPATRHQPTLERCIQRPWNRQVGPGRHAHAVGTCASPIARL